MMKYIALYLLLINAAAFILMLVDKFKEKRGLWRIPEKTLLLTAALGGSIGALAGMYLVRHKTKHVAFALGIPVMLAAQIFLAIWISGRFFS